jgi:DNA processing protein
MWPEAMARRTATTSTVERASYKPPDPAIVRQITLGDLLDGRRPLVRHGHEKLEAMFSAPGRALWCAGDIGLVQLPCVAIVGTREVSADGAKRARRLGRELATRGVVVSGLAKGVDAEALKAAMDAGGRVIAVIGTPLNKAYPAENAHLQERIARDHLLVTPFENGTRTFKSSFPQRNRVMAALTDATAIVEAGDTSGTLHQAAECLNLNRWLFICKNVTDDPSLTWPTRFASYERTMTLTTTADIEQIILPA